MSLKDSCLLCACIVGCAEIIGDVFVGFLKCIFCCTWIDVCCPPNDAPGGSGAASYAVGPPGVGTHNTTTSITSPNPATLQSIRIDTTTAHASSTTTSTNPPVLYAAPPQVKSNNPTRSSATTTPAAASTSTATSVSTKPVVATSSTKPVVAPISSAPANPATTSAATSATTVSTSVATPPATNVKPGSKIKWRI